MLTFFDVVNALIISNWIVPFVIRCHRLFTLGYEVETSDFRLLLRRGEYCKILRVRCHV